MTIWRHTLKRTLVDVVTLLLLHALLIRYLADHDIVSVIFSGGGQAHLLTTALAIFFIVVRLVCVLALPGFLCVRLGLAILDARAARNCKRTRS